MAFEFGAYRTRRKTVSLTILAVAIYLLPMTREIPVAIFGESLEMVLMIMGIVMLIMSVMVWQGVA